MYVKPVRFTASFNRAQSSSDVAAGTGVHLVMGCGYYVNDYQDPRNQDRTVDDFARVVGAAEKSLASEVAAQLPRSYEAMLGRRFEGGADLSMGQWQKIALARAYMRDAQVLVLDEPTSSLDARAEFEVFERFAELTRGKMAILISHRFSTVRMADRILVLGGGRIEEAGTHEELLARRGRYAELFGLQAAGYR